MNGTEPPARTGASSSASIWMFEQVLRAFGTGGITYPVVLAQMRRLIAAGISPTELMEDLRRRESIEPWPESAQGLLDRLNEEIQEAPEPMVSAEGKDADRPAPRHADDEALARFEERTREAESAAAARVAALGADLAAAQAALMAEQRRARELGLALAEMNAAAEASRNRVLELLRDRELVKGELHALRDGIAERDATILELRRSLDERDAKLAALQQDHAQAVLALEARADALSLELKAAQEAAAVLGGQLERSESSLGAALTELSALKSRSSAHLELLRTREWRRGLDQNLFRELAAGAGAAEAERDRLHAEVERLRRSLEIQVAPIDAAKSIANPDPGRPAELPAAARAAWITPALALCAAVLILGVGAWFFAHRAPVRAQVPLASSAATPKPGTVIRDCPTCPAMTVLPPGKFTQGSAGVEKGSASFEKPLHWVVIRRPIAMSTNVVTVDDFQQFIAATGRDVQGCDTYDGEWKHRPNNSWKNPGFMQTPAHPATCASWNDAEAYARWLSTTTGHRYRLPSASEWEYAARAGGDSVRPWSPDGSGACAYANVADQSAGREYPGWAVFGCEDGYVHTAPVGSFKANPFGLNDMLGNVFQWTEDCWHPNYTGAPIDGSARTDGDCSEHELRGGSWFTTPAYVRANYRNHFAADYRTSSVGFRLVRDLEQ